MTTKVNGLAEKKDKPFTYDELLSKDGYDFKTIIAKPMIIEGLNCNEKEVRIFLSKHLPRLLKIAIRNGTSAESLAAMKILTSKNASRITNLVKTSYFSDFATEILSKDNVSPMAVGKLSEIAQNLFRSGNMDFFSHAGFIILFLKYINNCAVCELFLSLFDFDPKMKIAQDWFFDVRLDSEIADLLKTMLTESNESDCYTFQQEGKISLLRIVNKALENKKTRQQILEGPIFSVFLNYYHLPVYINNFYWQTINCLYDQSTKSKLLMYAEKARNILINPIDQIHIYHAEVVKFLRKYILSNPELFDAELMKSVITAMMQFEKCELFLIKSANLIISICQSKNLQSRIEKYIPLFINEASDPKRSPFQIISIAIANELAYNPLTENFFYKTSQSEEFIKNTLEPYVRTLNTEYGVSNEDEPKPRQPENYPNPKNDETPSFWNFLSKFAVP